MMRIAKMTVAELRDHMRTMSATPGKYARRQWLKALDELTKREGENS